MNNAVTEPLPSEQDAELGDRRSQATGKKWSYCRTAVFVITASVFLWTLIVLGARGIF